MKTKASILFDELNRRYWRGRLPRYRLICRNLTKQELLGRCYNQGKTILLEKSLTDDALRQTLLHEMCHIGSGPGYDHGRLFLRKVRRLVRLGESKLIEDVERYDGTAEQRDYEELKRKGVQIHDVSFRQAVENDLDSLSMSQHHRRWPTILRWLADEYRMSPAVFRRVAPWAERVWRKKARLYR